MPNEHYILLTKKKGRMTRWQKKKRKMIVLHKRKDALA